MNHRTRIKICGITRVQDAECAADAGADAIGLVFHEPSPRCVDLDRARRIVAGLPAFVSTVGLFVNAEAAAVRRVLEAVPLDLLQFHGDEDEAYCRSFSRPYMKALRVRGEEDLAEALKGYPSAAALLLDSWHRDLAGGTGEAFDWARVPRHREARLVLAGGLHPGNVRAAIAAVKPYAVDVSTGVEEAPGRKSAEKIQAFAEAVNS